MKVFSLLVAFSFSAAVFAAPHQPLATRGSPTPARLSNGERLSRGLSPNPPASRRSSARRAQSSASPSSARGYIQVVDENGAPLGFISKITRMQYFVSSIDQALLVNRVGNDLATLNSDIQSPTWLGLVQGRESSPSLAKGSPDFLVLASTEQTQPNAPPQNVRSSIRSTHGSSFRAESAVWTIHPTTNKLEAQWINPDGSRAPTMAFVNRGNILFTGDLDAYRNRYSEPDVQRIEFIFVSI
ncbi:hypothetical protein C8R46DRAFT_1063576 [Mycena filopes]|nr:hypothetical protein C8R46DRAFT_1063576 [Mycena filopes]